MLLAMLAKELGEDPAAMLVAGKECSLGYELTILIVRDESEDESEIRAKVEGMFNDE